MGAYVMSGEFATSCVCRAPGSAPTASADPSVGAAIWTLGMAARYSGPIEMQEERRHERLTPH
jgi:hypothetical protein